MSADVYSSLLKALVMADIGDTSCYPVRVSAAGAIMELLEVILEAHVLCWTLLTEVIWLSLLPDFLFSDFRMSTCHLIGCLFSKLLLGRLAIMMKIAPRCFSFSVPWWRQEMKVLQFISHILFHPWLLQSLNAYLLVPSHGRKYANFSFLSKQQSVYDST